MKTCLICNSDGHASEVWTCPFCGEATWSEAPALLAVSHADSAPAASEDVGPVLMGAWGDPVKMAPARGARKRGVQS